MDIKTDFSHVVLFDKKETERRKNDIYYFKNSQGSNEPYIEIPSYRCTYQHMDLFQRIAKSSRSEAEKVRRYFEKEIPRIDMHPHTSGKNSWWTIESLFLISLREKKSLKRKLSP